EPPSEPSIPAMIETFEPGSNGLTPESFLDWSVWGLRFNAQTLSWASMASGYAAHATADGILPDGYVYTSVTVGGNAAAPLAGAADYAGVGFHACASVPLLLAIYTQHPTEASEAILYDTPVALTTEWQGFFVSWEEFSSGAFDWRRVQVTSLGSFDPSLFRGLYLRSHEGQSDYEVWIDNVQFITADQDT